MRRAVLVVFAGLVVAGAASGQSTASQGRSWNSLNPAQRAALAPLERDWNSIDATGKQRWLEVAGRLPSMPADERARMQERMASWSRLTPEQRGQARLQFQEARRLSPEERQQRWQAYQALPPERREELARNAKPAPVAKRPGQRADVAPKSNVVPDPDEGAALRPVAPTVVQTRPGASTRLLNQPARQPSHQQTGLPKSAATPGFVDSATLLPKRGAQAAATRPAPSGEPSKRDKK
jgi:hypothetical protein